MIELVARPPVPSTPVLWGFVQTVALTKGAKTIGVARWHASGSAAEGVVQLLDLYVELPYQRQGNGARLFKEVVAQASRYFKTNRSRLRRVWAAVEHEQHVKARAFLTAHGFHHITSTNNLYRTQEQLLYTRAFD
jgi:GNAT superfamily N-acetyltransferase